ncbi:hypothetical protein NEAUS06_1689 [Nematocida ausubeli]|nr:hypothetical protein NEAUS06_1689 [Nematocida ausubeli]
MQYVDPLGNIYRKDNALGRWVEIPQEHFLSEKQYITDRKSFCNYSFCMRQNVPIVALNKTNSLAVMADLDKEASICVINILLKENAYVPSHKILQYLSKDAVLEYADEIGAPSIIEVCTNRGKKEGKTKSEVCKVIIEKALEIGRLIEDEEYAPKTVIFLGITEYLSECNYMMHSGHIVLCAEYQKLKRHIKSHPLRIYCSVEKSLKAPINISMLECCIKEPEVEQSIRENRFTGPLKDCIVELSAPVVEAVFKKSRTRRAQEIVEIINSTASDTGLCSSIHEFYSEAFKECASTREEAAYLEVCLETEYCRLKEEKRLLSETEEGEIK